MVAILALSISPPYSAPPTAIIAYLLPQDLETSTRPVRRRGRVPLRPRCRALGRRPIDGYLFEGKRYDAGDKLGFLKATVEFALKREDLGKDFRDYLRALPLG